MNTKRTMLMLAAAAGFAFALPAIADDDADAKNAADAALADKAEIPAKPPTLPSTASDRATYVHDNIAFGKKGEAERLAHSQAEKQGKSDADDEAKDAANRAARGAAASAAGAANADGHSKAGHDRENAARGTQGSSPTTSLPTTGRR